MRAFLVALLLLLLAGACAPDRDTALLADSQSTAGLSNGLPGLPAQRSSTGLTETSKDGSATFSRSASALDNGAQLELSSAPGQLGWAIWELPADDELRYLDLDLSLPSGQPATQGAYIAIADYNRQAWTIEGPLSSGKVFELDPLVNASPGGALYVAVLVRDGGAASVQQLSLVAFHLNAAPTALLNADVTSGDLPLTVNFDASGTTDPEADIQRYLWDFDGDGGFELTSFTPLISHTYTLPGAFNATVIAEDSEDGRDSAAAGISVTTPGNNPPVAKIPDAVDTVGTAPLTVLFDTAGSDAGGDPGDSIVKYEWDFDGNGGYDTTTVLPQISYIYEHVSLSNATVRVTDSAGNQATASKTVQVTAPYTPVVSIQDIDTSISMTLVLGNPALVYADRGTQKLMYVRALDAVGQTWGTPVIAEGAAVDRTQMQLRVVANAPAICYLELPAYDLRYVRATTTSGSSWGTSVLLDSSGQTGVDPSMLVVDGNPAIAYQYLTSRDLRYIRANDAGGAGWPAAAQVVDSSGFTGTGPCLGLVNGNPAISYGDQSNDDLRFVRATDIDGTAWGAAVTLDGADGDMGDSSALMTSPNGQVLLAYSDKTTPGLRLLRATDVNATSWEAPRSILQDNFGADEISMVIINGNPAVLLQDSFATWFIRASDTSGTNWQSAVQLISDVSGDGISNLLSVGGQPAFSYVQSFALANIGDVYFARWD